MKAGKMFWKQFKENYSYAGLRAALTFAGVRVMYALVNLVPLQTMTLRLSDIDEKYFHDPGEGLVGGFLTRDQMIAFAETATIDDYDYWMDSIANGDRCYGFIDGDSLVSYGWYSTKPTKLTEEFNFVSMSTEPWVYMHNGHTNADYRGKRLHGIGMAQATKAVTEDGYLGLVSVVASDNPFSMRSIQRLGYTLTGPIYVFCRFNRFAAFHSKRAKNLGWTVSARQPEQATFLLNGPSVAA